MNPKPRVALCLPGGGVTGAMYQIGALAALEHAIEGFEANNLDLYVGASSGASVAAVLAGGCPVERLYRAFRDPADVYFPLERKHLLKTDFEEWARTASAVFAMAKRASKGLVVWGPPPSPAALWEELDRVSDSLPAGLFSLEAYERFLQAFFARRGIPTSFAAMPRPLRVVAHDLDSGELVVFGGGDGTRATVARACVASAAYPPIFSPVRIGDRYFIDAGPAQVAQLDVAAREPVDLLVVINPLVPVRGRIPSGRRPSGSVRDRGAIGVMNQTVRIVFHSHMKETCARLSQKIPVVVLEPNAEESVFFEPNPVSFAARRQVLEHAYRTTRARVRAWLEQGDAMLSSTGWRLAPATARAEGVFE